MPLEEFINGIEKREHAFENALDDLSNYLGAAVFSTRTQMMMDFRIKGKRG